jgi:hypothetical protein
VETAEGLRGDLRYPTSRRKTSEMPRISCTLDRTACAPLFKERRMKFN